MPAPYDWDSGPPFNDDEAWTLVRRKECFDAAAVILATRFRERTEFSEAGASSFAEDAVEEALALQRAADRAYPRRRPA